MDGSVSTLAPLFAAAFATHHNWQTFLVGLAASIGAGISMGFAEALSDDGSMTGRGSPWLRGVTCGLMTTVGGLGHTMPYLVPDSLANAFWIATAIAGRRGVLRTVGDRLYSRALHGHAVPAGGVPDRARRRHRARGRHPDRGVLARDMMMKRRFSAGSTRHLWLARLRSFSVVAGAAGTGHGRNPGLQRRHRGARPVHDPAAPQLYRARASRTRHFPAASSPTTPQRHAGIRLWRDRLVGARALSAVRRSRTSNSCPTPSSCGPCSSRPMPTSATFSTASISNSAIPRRNSRSPGSALEIRPIIGIRNADWEFIVNPIVDFSFGKFGEADFAPAARLARKLAPDTFVGPGILRRLRRDRRLPNASRSAAHAVRGHRFQARRLRRGLWRRLRVDAGLRSLVVKTIVGYAFPVPGSNPGADDRTRAGPVNPMSHASCGSRTLVKRPGSRVSVPHLT